TDTGRLATPGDVDMLAAAIRDAMTLDRARCRAHAEAALSLERMVDLYEELYLQLLRGRVAA
ncbi:MAG TPA: hypothetical protein VGD39_04445, partial [Nocardioides sp.]